MNVKLILKLIFFIFLRLVSKFSLLYLEPCQSDNTNECFILTFGIRLVTAWMKYDLKCCRKFVLIIIYFSA